MKWREENGRLVTEEIFENQTKLAEFLLEVARVSDKVGHHIDMSISYNKLSMSLFTHDEHKITSKDYSLAEKVVAIREKPRL